MELKREYPNSEQAENQVEQNETLQSSETQVTGAERNKEAARLEDLINSDSNPRDILEGGITQAEAKGNINNILSDYQKQEEIHEQLVEKLIEHPESSSDFRAMQDFANESREIDHHNLTLQ
jgi:hypothetical protein